MPVQLEISKVYVINRASTKKFVLRGLVNGKQLTRSTKYDKSSINDNYVKNNKVKIFTKIITAEIGTFEEDDDSLSGYGNNMIKTSGHIAKGEIQTHLSRFDKFITPYFYNIQISEISIKDVEGWQRSLHEDEGVTADRMSRSFDTFKMIMHYASGRLKFDDPFQYVKKTKKEVIKEENDLVDYYTFNEVQKMLDNCEDQELKLYINLAVFTGLRENEILALRKNSISMGTNEIFVKEAIKRGEIGAPKTNKHRTVPLLKPLREYLLSISFFNYNKNNGQDFVFISERKKTKTDDPRRKNIDLHYYDAEPIRAKFKILLDKPDVKIDWIGLYELKHSFATTLVEAGVPITAISKMLGHATVEMTMKHYIKPRKYNEDDIQKAEDYFNKIL